ncbi:MAG: glycosyltransferase family 9 protein [Deltaproteobacteria bacterium]|nr:glycosyltransferase family 9 protein [Deltaproteobacteria bacterium]
MIYAILSFVLYPFIWSASRLVSRRKGFSVLVFQTAKIGDMVCATTVFREIKREFPDCRLGVVATATTAPLIRNNPRVDEIIVLKETWGFFGKLRAAYMIAGKRYSAALILSPSAANILIALWALIPKRIAVYPDFIGRTLKELLNLNTNVEYHLSGQTSAQTCLKALRHIGVANFIETRELFESSLARDKYALFLKGETRPRVGIVLSTGNAMKDWGRENFLALARRIIDETGAVICLFGMEKERSAAIELINTINGRARVENLCGALTLEELPSVIRKLSLVIGVDTGLVYMADALGVPVIDIAGPCDMRDQRPIGHESRIVQRNDLECIPCSHTFKTPYECRFFDARCVTGISVDDVMKRALNTVTVNRDRERTR